jgi:hypothetical protein
VLIKTVDKVGVKDEDARTDHEGEHLIKFDVL